MMFETEEQISNIDLYSGNKGDSCKAYCEEQNKNVNQGQKRRAVSLG